MTLLWRDQQHFRVYWRAHYRWDWKLGVPVFVCQRKYVERIR